VRYSTASSGARTHVFIAGELVVWIEQVRPNRGHGQRILSASSRLANRLLGVRVEAIGLDRLDPERTYVFAPNHRSHVDATALMTVLPTARFAAKRELFDEPVLGGPCGRSA
jgi:1-acyl-sn-glycerol-3-phosphate acyltransferase